jgi:hypothetical protein
VAVTGSDVVRCRKLVARDASVLALHRILASRRRDWRLAPPTGIMMRALCEVRQSGATPRWDLPANPGLGVFATANIPVGTLLFWRLHEARLLPGSGVSPLLQSYAMVHSMRPFVLLCPGKSEWAARSARDVNGVQSLLGFGWRVNFAGEGDRVNVSLMKAGTFGDHFCFSVLKDITPTEELLFAPDFHYRSALVSVVNGSV